jgi:putative ATPase
LSIKIDQLAIELLAELSGGDARVALNALEIAVKSNKGDKEKSSKKTKVETSPSPPLQGEEVICLDAEDIKEALQKTHLVFDKKGEEFYNTISALHKSMRGSDANAALYWLARMLEGGADPIYIARRVVRFASEDIGMANSEALVQAVAAFQACHWIGMPECTVHLAQAVVYCAKSKKSNLLYTAYGKAAEDARSTSHLGVPLHIRNAPTKLMKELNYGKGYKYNPDYSEPVDQEYLPEELRGRDYFN